MKIAIFISILAVVSIGACRSHTELPLDLGARVAAEGGRKSLTSFDGSIIDSHRQLYKMSCIPSSVEMVLKLQGRVPVSYYDLQKDWKNKSDGSFKNFDGKTVSGVTFQSQFMLRRGALFTLEKLFEVIHSELQEGRFVIVSLGSDGSWHNWVIYDEDINGEFLAVTKNGRQTVQIRNAKSVITKMEGTDIGTYTVQERSP